MQPYQYTQQPWAESAHPGVPAVQTPQQTPPQQSPQQISQQAPQQTSPQQAPQQTPLQQTSQQTPQQTKFRRPVRSEESGQPQFQGQPALQPELFAPQQVMSRQLPSQEVLPQVSPGIQEPWTQQPVAQSFAPGAGKQAGVQATTGMQAASGTAGAGQPTAEQSAPAQVAQQPEQQPQVAQLQRGLPSVDVHETPDDIVVYADVPGCTPDDVELLANDNSITLVAKRVEPSLKNSKTIQRERVEEVERTIPLPSRADVDEAEATVEDGVCRITLPKREDDRKKRIGIQ